MTKPTSSMAEPREGSNNMNDRYIDILGEKMQAKVRPDDSGDRSIIGKLGDIVGGTLNGVPGYYVSLMYESRRKLTEVLKRFGSGKITQEGDSEAVIFFALETAMNQAQDLRVAINARKRPNLTIEQRLRKAVSVLQVRPSPDHLVGFAA